MEFSLITVLPLVTFALVIAFAVWSKRRTEEVMDDTSQPKSTLAKDGPGPNPFHPDK